jgi:hypothetical protein
MKQPVAHSGSVRDGKAIIPYPLLGELLTANQINGQADAM